MPTWCPPQPCLPQSAERPLTAEQVQHWRTHGWLVLSELWPRDLLAEAVVTAEGLFPTPEGYAAGESHHGTSNFPFDHELSDPLNQLTVHPRFVALSTQLLGTDEVRLTQASVSCRYDDDGEQGHHQDYGNNYLVCPPSDRIETVNAILYCEPSPPPPADPTDPPTPPTSSSEPEAGWARRRRRARKWLADLLRAQRPLRALGIRRRVGGGGPQLQPRRPPGVL